MFLKSSSNVAEDIVNIFSHPFALANPDKTFPGPHSIIMPWCRLIFFIVSIHWTGLVSWLTRFCLIWTISDEIEAFIFWITSTSGEINSVKFSSFSNFLDASFNNLDINGIIKLEDSSNSGYGVSGEVLKSQGINSPPIWQNVGDFLSTTTTSSQSLAGSVTFNSAVLETDTFGDIWLVHLKVWQNTVS